MYPIERDQDNDIEHKYPKSICAGPDCYTIQAGMKVLNQSTGSGYCGMLSSKLISCHKLWLLDLCLCQKANLYSKAKHTLFLNTTELLHLKSCLSGCQTVTPPLPEKI